MAKTPLISKEKTKAKYPNQWLLLEDCELDASTTLRKGRVLAHSKDRDEIHRALKKHSGDLCIHFTGSLPPDTGVHLLMPRVVYDPSVSSIVVDLLLEAADGKSSLLIPAVLDTGASLTIVANDIMAQLGYTLNSPCQLFPNLPDP